jgi:signal transduction histidine kinase
VVLEVSTIVLAVVGFALVGTTVRAAAVQSLLPLVVGAGMTGYGWLVGDDLTGTGRRVVLTWTTAGVVSFLVVGAWFGATSRLFETSYLLAVFASLSTGAAFGATVGVYAARLRHSNEALERKTDRLEEFTSVVSHDLRTPLSVAQGWVSLAPEDVDGHADDHLATAADAHGWDVTVIESDGGGARFEVTGVGVDG